MSDKFSLSIYGDNNELRKPLPLWLTKDCLNERAVRDRLELCRFQPTDKYLVSNQKCNAYDEGRFQWDAYPSLTPDSILRVVKTTNKYVVQLLEKTAFRVVATIELPVWLTEIDPVEQLNLSSRFRQTATIALN